jgi:methylated-DNA-[protein]-cysteine S-methyltransferase
METPRSLPEILQICLTQLDEYFQGDRQVFTIPTEQSGTVFQQQVWQQLSQISYGETRSYSDIARQIGNRTAVRAVGAANGRNQLWLVIPCHRVIGSNGQLSGYAGGVWRKQWLLEHEQARLSHSGFVPIIHAKRRDIGSQKSDWMPRLSQEIKQVES